MTATTSTPGTCSTPTPSSHASPSPTRRCPGRCVPASPPAGGGQRPGRSRPDQSPRVAGPWGRAARCSLTGTGGDEAAGCQGHAAGGGGELGLEPRAQSTWWVPDPHGEPPAAPAVREDPAPCAPVRGHRPSCGWNHGGEGKRETRIDSSSLPAPQASSPALPECSGLLLLLPSAWSLPAESFSPLSPA